LDKDTASLVFQATGSLLTIVGLVFVALQIRQARQEASLAHEREQQGRERSRRQATLEYARETLDRRYTNWTSLADDFDGTAIHEMLDECKAKLDTPMLAIVMEYLGLLETLCLGIGMDIYDVETVHMLYGGRIIAVAENYSAFIAERRKATRRPLMYVGLEVQAEAFRARESV
jgi:hypothetical protein